MPSFLAVFEVTHFEGDTRMWGKSMGTVGIDFFFFFNSGVCVCGLLCYLRLILRDHFICKSVLHPFNLAFAKLHADFALYNANLPFSYCVQVYLVFLWI